MRQTSKTDQYFLDSASNVSFFFEEEAFSEGGSLRQAKALSINKIGHGAFCWASLWCYTKPAQFLKDRKIALSNIATTLRGLALDTCGLLCSAANLDLIFARQRMS